MAEEPENFLYGINTKQEKAWQYLYAEYYSPLCCYALKILKDREYAMDVVQGIIVRLWEADTYFEDMPSFRGYLSGKSKRKHHPRLSDRKNSNEFHALGQTMEMFQFC